MYVRKIMLLHFIYKPKDAEFPNYSSLASYPNTSLIMQISSSPRCIALVQGREGPVEEVAGDSASGRELPSF